MSKKIINVEVTYGLPERQVLLALKVADGTTALEAVHQSDIAKHYPEADVANAPMGIFSSLIANPKEYVLKEGDRVEIYRPLTLDPKEARLRRASESQSRRSDP